MWQWLGLHIILFVWFQGHFNHRLGCNSNFCGTVWGGENNVQCGQAAAHHTQVDRWWRWVWLIIKHWTSVLCAVVKAPVTLLNPGSRVQQSDQKANCISSWGLCIPNFSSKTLKVPACLCNLGFVASLKNSFKLRHLGSVLCSALFYLAHMC